MPRRPRSGRDSNSVLKLKMFMLLKGEKEEEEDTWTLRRAARGLSGEKEGCGFDSRDGCARRHLFEIPELVMVVVVMVKMIRLMVMAPHSRGRRLQDKEERVRRGKNTRV